MNVHLVIEEGRSKEVVSASLDHDVTRAQALKLAEKDTRKDYRLTSIEMVQGPDWVVVNSRAIEALIREVTTIGTAGLPGRDWTPERWRAYLQSEVNEDGTIQEPPPFDGPIPQEDSNA